VENAIFRTDSFAYLRQGFLHHNVSRCLYVLTYLLSVAASAFIQVILHFVMTQGEPDKHREMQDIRTMLVQKRINSGNTNAELLLETITSRLKGNLIHKQLSVHIRKKKPI